MQAIYKEIITSRNGINIPKLTNGKTLESVYNPEADAERRLSSLEAENNLSHGIILVYGLGSGILIKKILEKYTECRIICIEYSEEDISLLNTIPAVKEISSKIILTTFENLYKVLLKEYIPSFFGNLHIIEQNNYFSDNPEYEKTVKDETKRALNDISHDYSVQAHFGKIWQHNILNNMKQYSKLNGSLPDPETVKTKICAVLAAGPSLEDYIKKILEDREKYYVLATDTAYSAAFSNKLTCDAVITLDAQNVSTTHFLHNHKKETLFLADYSSSPSLIHKLTEKELNLKLFGSGHPLFVAACKEESRNNYINAGSGTVTIAALDFAFKAGFTKIQIAGADFSFPKHKPYSRGTYLDSLYNISSTRTGSSEKEFCRLMFRTPLMENEKRTPTTEILLSYRTSLENYLESLKESEDISWKKEQNVYEISKTYENINKDFLNWNPKDFGFMEKFLKKEQVCSPDTITECLPYIAYLRRKYPDLDLNELFEMAKKDIRRLCDL